MYSRVDGGTEVAQGLAAARAGCRARSPPACHDSSADAEESVCMRRMLVVTATAAALGFLAIPVSAQKTTVAPSIKLAVPATVLTDASGQTTTIWPALGDSITFDVTYPKTVEKYGARVQVMCYQGDTLVYGEAGPYDQAFLLGGAGSIWLYSSQGPAHCKADLYYWSYKGSQQFNLLASTEFDAGGAQ